jgi:hypothetical protein
VLFCSCFINNDANGFSVKLNGMIEVFRGSHFDAMSVKKIIEERNIIVFTTDDFMKKFKPWIVSAGGFKLEILKVSEMDYDYAKQAIDDHNQSF